jgi:hypothetical protein
MSMWRMVGVLLVVLSVGVPADMFACGDKFLIAGRGTRFQRPKNARAANVLIYADPASAMGKTIKKEKIESVLKVVGEHRTHKVATLQDLSTTVSSGHYDVILTANGDIANVKGLIQSPEAPVVVGIDQLLKNHSLLQEIDRVVLQRDQDLKKTGKR